MASDPLSHPALSSVGSPAAVTNIEIAREQRVATVEGTRLEELQALRAELATERSAAQALLGAVRELEGRLASERANGRALLAAVQELDSSLQDQRRVVRAQIVRSEILEYEIAELDVALSDARRPLWRKLLRRR